MNKLSVLNTGVALAATFAAVNAICAILVSIWPVQAIDLANAWMHGLDLHSIRATAPLSWGRVAYGVVGISVVGFLVGTLYAWIYNLIGSRGT